MKKKPHIVFIYGFISVGKFTVAKELQKITKYRLVHNHMMSDLICNIFNCERPWSFTTAKAREWIQYGLTERIVKANINCIFTDAYSKGKPFKTEINHTIFIKKIKKRVEKLGGVFCPVYLHCEKKEMLKRLKNKSRKTHGKLRTIKIMKELLKTEDYRTPIYFENELVINTTNTSAKESAKLIKKYFKLNRSR
ncbi:MAG: AAA family ATPase [Patescibacteria group bacterium]|nr:AAA family ATPase [Patescibacteria group bacterium]